jgi:hypothetical protein
VWNVDDLRERIARAKGYVKAVHTSLAHMSDKYEWRSDLPHGWDLAPDTALPSEDAYWHLPNWPNDPAAAMGLLCEMWQADGAALTHYNGRMLVFIGLHEGDGATPYEAICKAWLAWKEQG